ncbi:MAG: imidazole glycerol phosphate synthase subunit HisH [Candidatus Omnitrophica bacterium]|nr:imidazole glycerol phosphate synthase subunit HisH [Candidatus Omnitrophota bacterium]
MIAIIDYGMGNLGSVAKACRFLGARVQVTDSPAAVRRARAVIFPGVGAFGAAMRELRKRRLVDPLRESIDAGKPFLGLCLGMQLLFQSSEESPGVKGLGIFPGRVRRLPRRGELKIPHMGWNQLEMVRRGPLLRGVPDGAFVYFVHSFYVDPEEKGLVSARTAYGLDFPSVLWDSGRVWATQFHPEKSQRWGLRILGNFLKEISC